MKRIITIVFSAVLCFSISAQEHFKFKGVEINGSISSFEKKLKQQIPDLKGEEGVYKGTFASKECDIYCFANSQGNVHTVAVVFPDVSSWTVLKSSFLDYCSIMDEKYGAASKKIRRFESPYEDGDGYEISAIRQDKVSYLNYYETEVGDLIVSIHEGNTFGTAGILIYYTDKANKAVEDRAKEKAAYDDF